MVNPKPLSANADVRRKQVHDEFQESLLRIANDLAQRDKTDEIQTSHIDESRELLAPDKRGRLQREFAKYAGGACYGAFVPGIYQVIHEATPTSPIDSATLIFYIILGLVGTGLTAYGFIE